MLHGMRQIEHSPVGFISIGFTMAVMDIKIDIDMAESSAPGEGIAYLRKLQYQSMASMCPCRMLTDLHL